MFFPIEIVLNKNKISPINKYGNSVKIAAFTVVMYVAQNFSSVFVKTIVLGKNCHNFIVPVFSKEHRLSFRLFPMPPMSSEKISLPSSKEDFLTIKIQFFWGLIGFFVHVALSLNSVNTSKVRT